jgi:hypothetical protein
MDLKDFEAPMNPFSEYALILEEDDYPKPEIVILQLRGKIDTAAFSESYDEAIKLVPVFSCHLVQRRVGGRFIPYWVPDLEVKNRLSIEDCRHMAKEPFELTEFSDVFFAERTRRRIDLRREFPFTCHLIRVKDDVHLLCLVFHHAAMDPFKGYAVMTRVFEAYHEKVTGKRPKWSGSSGSLASARKNAFVKPIPMVEFAKEQLSDVWIKHRKSTLSPVACEKIEDYHKVKGRHCLRRTIEDMDLIQTVVNRAVAIEGTFNDVLMAVTRNELAQWNKEHNAPANSFRMMLATSLIGRADLPVDSGAALAGLNFVSAGHENADLDTLIRFFGQQRRSQLSRGIDVRFYMTLDKVVRALRVLPIRTRIAMMRPLVQNIPCTASLSNTGSIWPKSVDEKGRQSLESKITGAGKFKIEQWHSNVSIARNLGMGLTCRTHNRRFYMDFVFDRFRFRRHEAVAITDRIMKGIENAT